MSRRLALLLLTLAACGSDGNPASGGPSRCNADADQVTCPERPRAAIPVGDGDTRTVRWQLPLGVPPARGWPVAILFQGSYLAVDFHASSSDPFGGYNQALLVKRLLDRGYAVLAPEALGGGSSFWQTNVPPWAERWDGSADDTFVRAILAAIDAGRFGPLDGARLFAAGISSGGYMTSRMALSYPGRFRALAVESASWATCVGVLCDVPSPLPADHPPTLFLHGRLDVIVPEATMEPYRDTLLAEGHLASSIVDDWAGHEWIAAAPDAIPDWFDGWRAEATAPAGSR